MLSNPSWVLLDQVVFSGSSFLTTLMLARGLVLEEFGNYAALLILAYLVLSVNTALIATPFQVLLARTEDKKGYTSSLLFMQLGFLVVLGLTGLGAVLLFPGILRDTGLPIGPLLFFVLAFLFQDFLRRLFLAAGQPRMAFYLDAISGGTQILWLWIASYFGSLNLQEALRIMTLTYLPALALGLFALRPMRVTRAQVRQYLRIHIEQGKWFLATSVLQWASQNWLLVAAGLYLGKGVLGAFRLGQTLFGVLNAILQVFENHAVPVASGLFHQSGEAFTHYLRQLNRKSMIGASLLLGGIALFAKPIYTLTGGPSFSSYAYILQGMSLLYFFIFLSNPVRIAIRVMMMNRAFFMAYLFSFVFSLLVSKWLIQVGEANGIIAGLILNQIIMLVYWQVLLIRKNVILWK